MSDLKVLTFKELKSKGINVDVLFWIGCSGSFDERSKKITKSFVKILNNAKISFGVLGIEESCTGDPAKRSGNEYLFQMQATKNIETLKKYKFNKIVTTCPHCFNTIKNEYPELGGKYEVIHHTQFLEDLFNKEKLKVEKGLFKGKRITYHDPCYLGRANNIYEAPRNLIKQLGFDLFEMKNYKSKALCCGAGGAQMFKDPEPGKKEINIKRTEEALETNPNIIAAACPFCNTMMSDGIKNKEKDKSISVKDITELICDSKKL